jgi:hypothetical protein
MFPRRRLTRFRPTTAADRLRVFQIGLPACLPGHRRPLHCRKATSGVEFTWKGNDEMDEASGDGWAEVQKDGSLNGEIRFHNGDDSTFKARPW